MQAKTFTASRWSFMQNMNLGCFSLSYATANITFLCTRHLVFDNKQSFFRSRIRQQNEQHNYNPLRIYVRRTFVLEDSYNQLRMCSIDNSKKSSLDEQSIHEDFGKAFGIHDNRGTHRVMNISWMPLRHSPMTMKISLVWFLGLNLHSHTFIFILLH